MKKTANISMSEESRRSAPDPLLVALEHICSAIVLLAAGQSAITTYTLAMAAEELIERIAKDRGVLLAFDWKWMIRDEFQDHWKRVARRPYNYFKHGNDDARVPEEWPGRAGLETMSEFSILKSVDNLRALGAPSRPETDVYVSYFAMKHYDLMLDSFWKSRASLKNQRDLLLPASKQQLQTALVHMLMQKEVWPKLSENYSEQQL